MTPTPLQLGQAPSELALNSAGFTPLALAKALRIGSSSPEYVAGLLRREPRIAPWSIDTTPAPAEVDDVIGDRDRLRLVLHDEHRVALVPQPQQQVVHPLDVVGVQARGGLVEDVGDVGERGAEVADHLDALRLAAGQRAGRTAEGEIAEPDLDERVESLLQR